MSNWYWKVKQRRGTKKALIALARKLLTIIYALLKIENNFYQEDLYEVLKEQSSKRRQEKIIKELTQKGFVISSPTGVT